MMKILFVDNCSQETYIGDVSIRRSNPPQGEMLWTVVYKENLHHFHDEGECSGCQWLYTKIVFTYSSYFSLRDDSIALILIIEGALDFCLIAHHHRLLDALPKGKNTQCHGSRGRTCIILSYDPLLNSPDSRATCILPRVKDGVDSDWQTHYLQNWCRQSRSTIPSPASTSRKQTWHSNGSGFVTSSALSALTISL